jgi:PAS domain S-box-containing protein
MKDSEAFMKKKPTLSENGGHGAGQLIKDEHRSEMMELFIESLADFAIFFLDTKGHIQTCNPAAERLFGWRADEMIRGHFSQFFTPEHLASEGEPSEELEIAKRHGRFEEEGWRVRKDGSRFWAEVVLTAMIDKKGLLQGFGKVVRDLTQRRNTEAEIKQQATEILEMATVPIVGVWEGVVLVPLIGTLDSQRSQHLMERLLTRIVDTNSSVAVLDITGVPTIDTQTAQHLIETISAVRLLGAEVILTGVRPIIAQTLVHLGIDLSHVTTRSALASGLRVALDTLNLAVVSRPPVAAKSLRHEQ